VCSDYQRCVDCGHKTVKRYEDLMEACHPDEEGHERKNKSTSTSSTEDSFSYTDRHDNRNKGSTHETTTEEKDSDDFGGEGDGTKRISSELTTFTRNCLLNSFIPVETELIRIELESNANNICVNKYDSIQCNFKFQ
jgi:hypothetical protein